jgi:hypothetical protein
MTDLIKKYKYSFTSIGANAKNETLADKIEKWSIHQPSYVTPIVTPTKLNGGYQQFGKDNIYPEYLLNIYFGSSQHQGLIQRKVDEVLGNGLHSATENPELNAFIGKCNGRGQTMNEVLRKCYQDCEIFGGFALQIIYGKLSTAQSPKIAELYYIDISKLRWNLDYTKLKYAKNWKDQRVKTIQYDVYDPNDPTGTKIYYYSGTMTRDWYPVPQYLGSIPAIETAIDIANFNQNTLRNGFFPSVSITLKDGEPTEEEKAYIERSIQEKWGGTSNSGRIMITYTGPEGKGPDIVAVPQPNLDKMFSELKVSVIEDIFIGHRITDPSIFGLAVPGKLGSSDYTQSYAIFQNVYVRPQRRIILNVFNDVLNPVMNDADLEVLEIEPVNNVFKDEALIASQMTQSEIRVLLKKWGYITTTQITPGQKTIVETDIATGETNSDGSPKTEPLVNVTRPRVKLKKIDENEYEIIED